MPENLGDKIAENPIVHAVGKMTGCVDPETNQLRPNSPCAKARQQLNDGVPIWDVFYERFFGNHKHEGKTMPGETNKQVYEVIVAVETDGDALSITRELIAQGKVKKINPVIVAQPRPVVNPALAARQAAQQTTPQT